MTDGLIVKQPFATQIVKGKKKFEYRKTRIPPEKIGKTVFILTPQRDDGKIIGQATFYPSNIGETTWRIIDPLIFTKSPKYKIKSGCVIWMNDVICLD